MRQGQLKVGLFTISIPETPENGGISLTASVTLQPGLLLYPKPSLVLSREVLSPFSVAFFNTFMAYKCPLSGRVTLRTRKT